jgi:diguanylate cyclase (GGDEF)-like protein/PAS domain S-box-containing protein/putative nucleotidyltransferase with HDIG domain
MLFEAHPQPMWIYDVESLSFLDVNQAAVRRYGYSRDEFLSLTVADISPAEDAEAARAHMAGLPAAAHVEAAGCRHRLKDGSVIAVEIASSAVEYSGRRARLVLACDITTRLRMEGALRQAEAKYHGIFENAQEGIFQTSPDGRYLDANPALARIYGYDSVGDLIAGLTDIGRQLYVDPARRPEFARLMSEHDFVQSFESQVRRRDGSIIWISESSRAVRDSAGRLLHYEGMVEDITQRKLAEQKIRALNAELESRLQRVAALRRIDMAIIEGRELNTTLEVCLDQVIAQLGADAAVILLCDPSERCLHHGASRGLQTETLRHARIPIDEGLAGKAVVERRFVYSPDSAADRDELATSPLYSGEDFVACVVVPLVAKDRVKGVLKVLHRSILEPAPEWFEFLEILAGQAAIAIDNSWLFDDLRRSNAELAAAYDATIEGWSRALDLRDQETEGHSRRVTEMTVQLARAMGVPEAELVHVRWGALLHDIGKMGIPDRILHKPGPLSEEEWRVMRRHPQYAHEMLRPIAFLCPALAIPYCHHERWDGSGYPAGLKAEEIPLPARIFAAVDVWDALRSDRPYRPAWSDHRVREHLASLAGTHLDPAVVAVFLRTLASGQPETAGAALGPRQEWSPDAPARPRNDTPQADRALEAGLLAEGFSRSQPTGMMILLAQDHAPSTDELTRTLETLGHTVQSATNDEAAWQVVKGGEVRLVITDWTTSGIDAPRLCRRIRSQSGRPYTYIIVMTDRGESADRLECLHAGADDFLPKPADARELAARLEIARRILSMQEELEQKNERLAELVTIDSLTGLKNRRHFREVLDAAYAMAVRHQQPLSVVMLDVDAFKRYNDTFGHPAGDEVLCAVAGLLRDGARQNDVVSRFGGEEFAILLPATDAPGGLAFAERLRTAITEYSWPRVPVTASLGVATITPETPDGHALVEGADQALYQAKRMGRNRVVHHADRGSPFPGADTTCDYAGSPFGEWDSG